MHENLKPPTDCLYKFMAIAGLAISAFSVWAYFSAADRAVRKLEESARLLAYEQEEVSRQEKRGLNSETIDKKSDDVAASLAELKVMIRHLQPAENLSVCGFVTGGTIAFAGFLLWYIKVQRHQDAILLAQRHADTQSPPAPPPKRQDLKKPPEPPVSQPSLAVTVDRAPAPSSERAKAV